MAPVHIFTILNFLLKASVSYNRLERLVRDKHSSLLGTFESYEENEVL